MITAPAVVSHWQRLGSAAPAWSYTTSESTFDARLQRALLSVSCKVPSGAQRSRCVLCEHVFGFRFSFLTKPFEHLPRVLGTCSSPSHH